jgi:hypothetical protein
MTSLFFTKFPASYYSNTLLFFSPVIPLSDTAFARKRLSLQQALPGYGIHSKSINLL